MAALPERPVQIATWEQEIVRLAMYGRDVLPTVNILEEPNFVQPHAQWDLKANPEGKLLFVTRLVVPVSSSLLTSGVKLWMATTEVPGAAQLSGNAYTTNSVGGNT